MEPRLQHQLSVMESMLRRAQLWRRLTFCWVATAGAALVLVLVRAVTGWDTRFAWWLVLLGGVAAAWIVWVRQSRRPQDFGAVVAAIERENPEIRLLLATAAEQQPDPLTGEYAFLQLRVIDQVRKHPNRVLWVRNFRQNLSSARNTQLIALAGLLVVLSLGFSPVSWRWRVPTPTWFADEIAVTPGDTQLERGSGLVVSARFGGRPPAEATLVLVSASGKSKRIPLARNLADPVFGTSLMEVSESGLYRIEYGSKKTRDYKISVFDYPALSRADADLRFPSYTGLTNQIIRDTRRVSAVEGTRLTYTLELNKPVARARLIGKDQALGLTAQTNALAMLEGFTLTNSGRYALELVDTEGRTNKAPTEFVIQVLPNRPPEVKVAFPRGDQRVSSLEEMQLQGEARDDFGLLKYGLGFGVAGQEPQFVELGQSGSANEKRQFTNQIAMEKLGVEVDQVISYFAWAEDYGPDGQVRRTFGDMFFAEVRPFEEIFRRDQSGQSESQSQSQSGSQGGSPSTRLAELQKQIVIATWKLQRDKRADTIKP